MAHPLETVINEAEGFLIIGESNADRFPGFSYNAYTKAGKRFYCLDLDGLTESRGPTKGGKVYPSPETLPDDVGDLAILWTSRKSAARAVEIAHQAGCTRVWFSFGAVHDDAVAQAKALGMEIVEIGRCPVYYLKDKPGPCAGHTLMTKVTGTWRRPPQTEVSDKNRELW